MCTQKFNSFRLTRSDLFSPLLSPQSLKSNGLCCLNHPRTLSGFGAPLPRVLHDWAPRARIPTPLLVPELHFHLPQITASRMPQERRRQDAASTVPLSLQLLDHHVPRPLMSKARSLPSRRRQRHDDAVADIVGLHRVTSATLVAP